jgi:integrase
MLKMTKVRNLNESALLEKPGRHRVADKLFMKVLDPDRAYWVVRYSVDGVSREISLGSAHKVARAVATGRYHAIMADVNKGVDPLKQKRDAKAAITAKADVPTFGECADAYLKAHEAGWRNPKHRQQWAMTLREYAAPIRETPVDQIDAKAVMGVLEPIWKVKPETASRLRGRIEMVLASAQVAGHINPDRPNPARWKGWLKHMLPEPKKLGKLDRKTGERIKRSNHNPMPYRDVPAFMARLKETPGVAAKALMFTILTCARTSETLGMIWDEVSFGGAVWRVPGERMKMGEPHDVPLSEAALRILADQMGGLSKNPFVFPGGRPRQPLSTMAMAMLLRRMGAGEFTVHGMRSAFRDWATEVDRLEYATAERCLAHVIGSKAALSYDHSNRFELRQPAMERWAKYVEGKNNVVPLKGRGRIRAPLRRA